MRPQCAASLSAAVSSVRLTHALLEETAVPTVEMPLGDKLYEIDRRHRRRGANVQQRQSRIPGGTVGTCLIGDVKDSAHRHHGSRALR